MASRSDRNRRKKERRALASRDPAALDPVTDRQIGGISVHGRLDITAFETSVLPHPVVMEEYDRIDPGRAAKLFDLAAQQSRHRMFLEKFVGISEVLQSWSGQACALTISLFMIHKAATVAIAGHPIAAVSMVGGTLATLVGIFIYGKSSTGRERAARLGRFIGKR